MKDDHAGALIIAGKEYGDMKMAYLEAERYAAKLEAACEHIREVCRLAKQDSDSAATFDVISSLAEVKDDRRSIK